MQWVPLNKDTYPLPSGGCWDGKTFVALKYEPRGPWDSGQVEAVTAMYAWNNMNGGGDRRATHFCLLPSV